VSKSICSTTHQYKRKGKTCPSQSGKKFVDSRLVYNNFTAENCHNHLYETVFFILMKMGSTVTELRYRLWRSTFYQYPSCAFKDTLYPGCCIM